MRRLALILLIVLLPLQSSWAAVVVNACAHEGLSSGRHAASDAHHHAHAHELATAAAAADDGSAATQGTAGHAAGSPCHGHGIAAVLGESRVTLAIAAAAIVPSPYARFIAERFLESPLRPPVLQLV